MMKKLLIAFFIFLVGVNNLSANSFRLGLSKYKQGDLPGAERAFMSALRKANSETKADIYLYLSIVRHMNGKHTLAKQNLTEALRLNPYIYVPSNHLVDYDYLSFFNQVKSKFLKSRQAWVTVQTGQTSKGKVFIKGRVAGVLNKRLAVTPGSIELEVRAYGYERKFFKVNTSSGEETLLVIKLDKIPSSNKKRRVMIIPREKEVSARELKRRPSRKKQRRVRKSVESTGYSSEVVVPFKAKKATRKRKSMTENKTRFMYFLPFGIPQFSRGETALGLLYGGAQAGLLFAWHSSRQSSDEAFENAKQKINEQNESGDTESEELTKFRESTQSFIDAEEQKQSLLLTGFVLLWAGSSIHAITSQETSSVANISPSDDRRPTAKLLGVSYDQHSLSIAHGIELASDQKFISLNYESSW